MTSMFVYILLILNFFCLPFIVLADTPHSALDGSPSVEQAAMPSSAAKEPLGNDSISQEPRGQASYVYDLKKLIDKSRTNIKQVNEKIKEQAVVKRNQKREEKAREYYEQGLKLTDEGKLDQAREYFEKAVKITEHPEMSGYVKDSERRLKLQDEALKRQATQRVKEERQSEESRQQEVEQTYVQAVSLYREKKFHESKDTFEHVEELQPNYKAVRSYLRIIDQEIIQVEAIAIKQQKLEMERQQKEAEIARNQEKENWKKELEEKEHQRKEQIIKQADLAYNEAVMLYKDKKYLAAKQKFQEIEWVSPNYKATSKYLSSIDKDIQAEEQRAAIEKQKALEKQQWEEMVAKQKAELQKQKEMEEAERQHKKQLEDEAQFLYQSAITLFEKEVWDQALEKFKDVEKVMPSYKAAKVYIAKINQIKAEKLRREEEAKMAEARKKAWEEEKVRREIMEKEQRQLLADTEAIYVKAIDDLKSQRFEEAKNGFMKVNEKIKDYKSSKQYLAQVDIKVKEFQEKKEREAFLAKKKIELEALRQQTAKADKLYSEAVAQYRQLNYIEAKANFEAVNLLFPAFKDTPHYLAHIDQDIERQRKEGIEAQERQEKEKERVKANEEARLARQEKDQQRQEQALRRQQAAKKAVSLAKQEADFNKEAQDLNKEKRELAQRQAEVLRRQQEELQALASGKAKAGQEVVVEQVPVIPEVVADTGKADDQIIDELAAKSNALYRQIMDITGDPHTKAAKNKLAKVDELLTSIKRQKELTLKQIRQQQLQREKAEAMEKERQQKERAELLYRQGQDLLKMKDFDNAKSKFHDLNSFFPNYKNTVSILAGIEENIRLHQKDYIEARNRLEEQRAQALREKQEQEEKAIFEAEKARQAEALRQEQERLKEQELARKAKEREQQERAVALAKQAEGINDVILDLAKQQNYALMKEKFAELEGVLLSLKALKDEMARAQNEEEQDSLQMRRLVRHQHQAKKLQRRDDRREKITLKQKEELVAEGLIVPGNSQEIRIREARKQANALLNEAAGLYDRHKYTQAKLLLGDLAARGDKRAIAWLNKIDRVLAGELKRSKNGEEKERRDFVQEKIYKQRQSSALSAKERDRQKKFTNELEHQKRLWEDNNQRQRLKEEALSVQERQRQRIEETRKQQEDRQRKQEEQYKFRKVSLKETKPPVLALAKEEQLPVLTKEKQRITFSQERKEFLEKQYKEAQLKKEEEQKKAQEEQKKLQEEQKKIEEEKKRVEEQRRVEEQKKLEDERQNKIKAQKETKKSSLDRVKEKQLQKEAKEEERLRKLQEARELKLKQEEERQTLQERKMALKEAQDKDRVDPIKEKAVLAKASADRIKEEEAALKRREESLRIREEALKEREQVRLNRIKELEEAANRKEEDIKKRLLDKQEARKREEDLRKQEQELKAKERQERIRQEEENRQKELQRKEQEAREREAVLQIARDEAKKKADIERQVRERQQKLDAERSQIRAQLEKGVEAIYLDATKLYKSGQYAAAADKFQDIQDVLPNYKNTLDMIQKSRSQAIKPVAVVKPLPVTNAPIPSQVTIKKQPSREDAVGNTLDLFEVQR